MLMQIGVYSSREWKSIQQTHFDKENGCPVNRFPWQDHRPEPWQMKQNNVVVDSPNF